MTSYKELKETTEQLAQQIASASLCIQSGEVSDVTDLPKVTDFLCQEISKLPLAERSKLSTKMLSLIEELDNLSNTIRASLANVKLEMQETTSHNRAARAYTTANTPRKK